MARTADAEEHKFAQGIHAFAGLSPALMEAGDNLCSVCWVAGKPQSVPPFPQRPPLALERGCGGCLLAAMMRVFWASSGMRNRNVKTLAVLWWDLSVEIKRGCPCCAVQKMGPSWPPFFRGNKRQTPKG